MTKTTRTAVVTGAAGDLGGAVARRLAANGWTVFGADITDTTASEPFTTVTLDVQDRAGVFALAERAGAEGPLGIWVNAAGIAAAARIIDADPATWNHIIGVNLTGSFHGCAAALRAMSAGTGGRIVNVGSISGQIGGLGMHPAYAASKAGVHALTKSYALEGVKHGVMCNAVAPSVIEGAMARSFSEAQLKAVIATNPMRRLATMDEVVEAICFLADPARSGYINGVTLPINGGAYMP